eukprot:1159909-Pelagomonas_calceolata.AAC.2
MSSSLGSLFSLGMAHLLHEKGCGALGARGMVMGGYEHTTMLVCACSAKATEEGPENTWHAFMDA